ncbi:pentatricopeptide repeat-containing protein 2, mitochondrial-like [Phymastichus coffea]|uniref:pentatricopeptide repeat-containing protein 2, mitochondrial-like n=1 Tax=Phymastichus coffea TaxID=108790 RepID=UPI00273B385C|nr:pentatricopeptide repeat-containing protein 2, mitochondrial-like [Phymastichus coffea]
MAICVKNIAKTSFNLLSKNVFKQFAVVATRQLYAPHTMGMNGYLNARDYVKSQFLNVENLFFDKMKDFVEKKDESMIFTEDLKTMLHLVEKKPEQLNLLLKMMKNYNSQNNLRFGSFVFGTVAMRAFYHLNEPELALQAFKDPELTNFFDQVMSYQLLLDMLYNHGKYAECREVYNMIKSRTTHGIVHPKNPFIIVIGACYQENTEESFKYALDLFKETQTRDFTTPRRALTFMGALALKQNNPTIALETASLARNARYIDIRCIKIEAYIKLKRIDEIIVYFRSSLQQDLANRRKQLYFKDTIKKVEQLVKDENLDDNSDLVKSLEQIKIHDYVQQTTLDEHISTTIDYAIARGDDKPWARRNLFQQNNQHRDNEYDNQSRIHSNRYPNRSGEENISYDRNRNYNKSNSRPSLKDVA